MFRSLSSYNYRIWFIGALVSNVGSWMQATTQNWVVLVDLTDNDAVAVGITMALQFGPQLVLVPFTGLIADRFDRRKILIFTQSALMTLGASLGVILLLGIAELWHLYLFALLLGIVNAIDGPARQVFISDLVDEHNMANAVALNSASFNAARLIGPAFAGFLIVLIGSGWVFIANAATFIAVLIALGLLNKSRLRHIPRAPRAPGQFVEGFRYVRGRPDLIAVFAIVFLVGAFAMNFPIVASTMAVEFGRGADAYGMLSSILAIGSLSGALLAARRERARFGVIIIAVGGLGAASLLSALMPGYWTFAFSLVFTGFTAVTMLTTANAYVQTTTAPAVRGRVMALYMAVLMGGTPIGAPIVGAVANALGPRWALIVAALAGIIGCAIGVGWLAVARELRVRSHPNSRWRLVVTHAERSLSDVAGVRMPIPTTTTPIAVISENPLGADEFDDELAHTSPITIPQRRKP